MDKSIFCSALLNYFIGSRNECWYSYDLDKTYYGSRIRAYEKVINTIEFWRSRKCISISHIQDSSKYYLKYNKERLDRAFNDSQKEYYWCFIQSFNYIMAMISYYATMECQNESKA